MSLNVTCLVGNVVRDATLSQTSQDVPVLNFTIAVNDRRRGEDGSWEMSPNFIDCTLFGTRAEGLSRHLVKGSHISVVGKLRQNTWTDAQGHNRSRITVIVDDVEFLSRRDKATVIPDTIAEDLGF